MLVADFINHVRNLAACGDTGSTGAEDTDLLAHADSALQNFLMPRLLNLREDYFVLRQRNPITAASTRYPLPARAAFNKLRDLWLISPTGRVRLDLIYGENLNDYTITGNEQPGGYLLEGDYVVLVPEDAEYSGSLEFAFFQRPGNLVLSTDYRQIAGIAGNILTLSAAAPAAWTSSDLFDIHSNDSGAALKVWDQAAAGVSGLTLTLALPPDGSVYGTTPAEVGDYVVLAGKSALPCLPSELHGLLARATALQFAESSGDTARAQLHGSVLEKYFNETTKALEQRVESQPLVLGATGLLQQMTRNRFQFRR